MSKLRQAVEVRLDEINARFQAVGVRTVCQAGPESGTLTGTLANGDGFTVSVTPGVGSVAASLTVSPRQGMIAVYAAAEFDAALDRFLRRIAGRPAGDRERFEMAGCVPAIKALRLVCVETADEGIDLVSLTHGCVIASGDDFGVGPGIPCVVVGEVEEQEARRLAGVPRGEGWPGWDVILPWLDRRFPAGN